MPCGVYKVTDVTDDGLNATIGMFQLDQPKKVETTKQGNGKWTVIATFAPCEGEGTKAKTTLSLDDVKAHLSVDALVARLTA